MSDYDTKPTIETVLERMDAGFTALRAELSAGLQAINDRLYMMEKEMLRQDDKLDMFIRDVIDLKREMRRA